MPLSLLCRQICFPRFLFVSVYRQNIPYLACTLVWVWPDDLSKKNKEGTHPHKRRHSAEMVFHTDIYGTQPKHAENGLRVHVPCKTLPGQPASITLCCTTCTASIAEQTFVNLCTLYNIYCCKWVPSRYYHEKVAKSYRVVFGFRDSV